MIKASSSAVNLVLVFLGEGLGLTGASNGARGARETRSLGRLSGSGDRSLGLGWNCNFLTQRSLHDWNV